MPLAVRPGAPGPWRWSGALLLLLLLAGGGVMMFVQEPLQEASTGIWGTALSATSMIWGLLLAGRLLQFFSQQRAADGWDQAREADWRERMEQGRRFQQVLNVSLYTELRDRGRASEDQLRGLLGGAQVVRTQPSRQGAPARHSRLGDELGRNAHEVLQGALNGVLADLAQPLALLPDDAPMVVLLEADSTMAQSEIDQAWHQAWQTAAIRQPTTLLRGDGLETLDSWLDQQPEGASLMLVVAFRVAPQPLANSAEAAVGVLLGGPAVQAPYAPLASLHRPQRAAAATSEAWLHAIDQSLGWVPLQRCAIDRAWRVGIGTEHDVTMSSVLCTLSLPPRDLGHVDAVLGHPGKASPWLAIAAAAQAIEQGAGPQVIFSGGGSGQTAFWSTVVAPVPPSAT